MTQPTNPVKAIRANCIECMGNQANLVKDCSITRCPLWPFRMGKNPFRKPRSEEQRQAAAERMAAMREKQLKA